MIAGIKCITGKLSNLWLQLSQNREGQDFFTFVDNNQPSQCKQASQQFEHSPIILMNINFILHNVKY